MMSLDRDSDESIHVQLVRRLKYMIASGEYQRGFQLPSTRKMADQLDVSFHTIRKAYAELVREGMLDSVQGRGFTVSDFRPLSKSLRMEQGAMIASDALIQLIGLGLDETEIDYLMQEQMELLGSRSETVKIIVAGNYREWGIRCAMQLAVDLARETLPATIEELVHHADADYLIVPFRLLRTVLSRVRGADILGIQTELGGSALGAVSRLLEKETLGLITGFPDAIGPLSSQLRQQTRFGGQILAVSVEGDDSHLRPLVEQCDLILFTELAKRRALAVFSKTTRHALLTIEVSTSSIQRIREVIPG